MNWREKGFECADKLIEELPPIVKSVMHELELKLLRLLFIKAYQQGVVQGMADANRKESSND